MDVDTQKSLTWAPALPAPAVACVEQQFTQGWPMRRGATQYGGTVTWDGSPAERRVYLLDLPSLSVLHATLSSPVDGSWSLGGWDSNYAHLALSVDSSGTYQAIAYDRV